MEDTSAPAVAEVTKAEVVSVQPGDVIVYQIEAGFFSAFHEALKTWHQETFGPEVRALFIEGRAIELSVHRKGDPSPEVARPGEWVEVTCQNVECLNYRTYTTDVAEAVYDVLPPSCPECGHELEAV